MSTTARVEISSLLSVDMVGRSRPLSSSQSTTADLVKGLMCPLSVDWRGRIHRDWRVPPSREPLLMLGGKVTNMKG